MNWGDIIFYVLDAVIAVMLARMLRDSGKVEIEAYAGPKWVIPGLFWSIALISVFTYQGIFRIIHTAVLIGFGIVYWFMKSGLSPEGVVMIGRLYPYEKSKPIKVHDENRTVDFTIRKAPTTVSFPNQDMHKVRAYLSDHAGMARKEVREKH